MTECYYPDPELFDAMRVQNILLAPPVEVMGNKAPKCCMIDIDYKDESGVDSSEYAVILRPADLTDEALVESVRNGLEQRGFKLSAVTEYVEGKPLRLIYVERSFFEETLVELNRPIPKDMKSALEAFGYHPINLEDFA